MAARLLATVSQPKAVECVKGRFFDRFSTNELVLVDLQAVAAALSSHC